MPGLELRIVRAEGLVQNPAEPTISGHVTCCWAGRVVPQIDRASAVIDLGPGGNLTGVSRLTAELIPKRLELLHEVVPGATVVGDISNPKNPLTEGFVRNYGTPPV